MKRFWDDFKIILPVFIFWRLVLFLVSYVGIHLIPGLGNRYPYVNYILEPTGMPSWIWGFGGFDGVHYLKIAQYGYVDRFTQAFFPLYPYLIRIINIFPKDIVDPFYSRVDPTFFAVGLVISNISFLLLLIFFYKLLRIDFKKSLAYKTLLLVLVFPTSFYFGSIYGNILSYPADGTLP